MSNFFYDGHEIKNSELLALQAKIGPQATTDDMLNLLEEAQKARFIIPVSGEDKVSFHAMTDSRGKLMLVVYGSTETYYKACPAPARKAFEAGFEDLLSICLAPQVKVEGFILDPGEKQVIFGNDMLAKIQEAMPERDTWNLGNPSHMPKGMPEIIVGFGQTSHDVKSIYVKMLQKPDGKSKPKWLFIIDHNGDRESIFNRFKRLIEPALDGLEAEVIDMTDAVAEPAVKDTFPIFSK